jgi:molybdopterin converting factor small subunit
LINNGPILHMEISLELFATLEKYYPDGKKGPQKIDLPLGSTVANLVKKLGMPDNIRLLMLVNGQQSDKTTALNDKDEIFIFVPAAGG